MKDGDKINMGRYRPIENEIFHVHTWRCKHAGEEREWEYIERAIELGAERIVFSNDGLIYYTDDHYESFILLYDEDGKAAA